MRGFEDNPMLSVNVKLWKFLSVLLAHNWRLYLFVVPVCMLNVMQFIYLYQIWGELAPFILNTFFAAAVFDALLRTLLVIINRQRFETFMQNFHTLYCEIEESEDCYSRYVLRNATRHSRIISIFSLGSSAADICGALLYPILSGKRVHPFGVALPGVDMTAWPIYEIMYFLQVSTPFVLTAMYMPFVGLFASFAMFGCSMLKILQHRLRSICAAGRKTSDAQKYAELLSCIAYYSRIYRYVKDFNALVTYIIFVEFMLFSAIICSLLFCLNIIDSISQFVCDVMYIFTMLYVLFIYYYQANEIMVESVAVSQAAYSMSWYSCTPIFKKTLLIFIGLTQHPLMIMVGNMFPMSLATFQSLLNTSYSYFTFLRGVSNN